MQSWIVKEIPFDSPDLVVHLLPLVLRLDAHFHRVQFQHPFTRLRWSAGTVDEPVLVLPVQHLFTVERHVKGLHAVENLVGLACLQIELVESPALGLGRGVRVLHMLQNEQDAGLTSRHRLVIARRNGQRHDPLADVFEIDLHLDRLRFRRIRFLG